LILDEPTVGLDAESEYLVFDALQKLMAGRTTCVISHHLYTIQRADMIIVLTHGRIAEIGTHDDLLMRKGGCAAHYDRQSHHDPVGVAQLAVFSPR
jgi:ABC-type multidrug transport system fused ATPase/permease subunit